MKLKTRSMLALALVGLGALGLMISASGALPGAPAWCWLAVLALGVVAHVATEAARQRQRLSVKQRRHMAAIEERLRLHETYTGNAIKALAERLDSVGTPEGMKAFRDTVQKIANDVAPLVEAFHSGKLAESLRARVGRQ